MAKRKKKSLEDICFPVPENLSLTTANVPVSIDSNERLKKSLFQQTIQIAYKIGIPYKFTSSYDPEKPYQLVSEEQIETVTSLFQALQPQDAVEAALIQQFIVVHLQSIESAHNGIDETDVKKIELTHKILETLQKYRTKGAQLINVQYNVNKGQVFNDSKVNINANQEEDPITIEGKTHER